MTALLRNRELHLGDNLAVLRGLPASLVDLVYLDPPFNSGKIHTEALGDGTIGQEEYKNVWREGDLDAGWVEGVRRSSDDLARALVLFGRLHGEGMRAYLTMLAVRLIELKRVLKTTGSLYLHCDPTASHYLKVVLDGVFGAAWYRNEITWKRHSAHNNARRYGNITDIILFYAHPSKSKWNRLGHERSARGLQRFRRADADGRRYRGHSLVGRNRTSENVFEWRGVTPKSGWRYTRERLDDYWAQGRILVSRDGRPAMDGLKVYLDELGAPPLQNLWTDVHRVPNTSSERVGYRTQKPVELLERIIGASSDEGDLVLDPFVGSGTTLVAAERLGRRWLGIDESEHAASIAFARAQEVCGVSASSGPRLLRA